MRWKQGAIFAGVLLVFFALVACTYFFGRYLLVSVLSLDKQLAAAVIAVSGALGTLLISQHHVKSREIRESHRPQKIAVYNRFMEAIVDVLRKSKEGQVDLAKGDLSDSMADFVFSFTRDLIIWGSPGVIKAFEKFRRISTANPSPQTMLFIVDDMLREFRKDLGNSNFGLSRGELVALFLEDPDELNQTR